MKRQPMTSVLCLFVLLLAVGLACNIPTQTPSLTFTSTSTSEVSIPSDEVLVVTGSGSVMVSSGEAGVVTINSGAQLEIPNGAVPPSEDGSPGTAEFSMDEDTSTVMELPSEFSQIGPIYRLMPEGAAFGMPVKLTLPIPNDVEAENVLGVATFDDFSGTWQLLPAVVNEQAHTVVIEVGHFSYYGLFGLSSFIEFRESWAKRNGGWFSILNTHRDGGELAPFGKPLPASVYYGVCVQEVVYDNSLVDTWNWRPPTDWMIGATALKIEDFRVKRWLPAGTYTLMEFYGIGETNNYNIDYYPEHRYYVRPMGQVYLGTGQQIEFVSPAKLKLMSLEAMGFTWSKHPCWMKPMDTPPVEPGDNWSSVEVVNTHRHLGTKTHFGKHLPAGVYYGVCSPNRVYDDSLAETWNWRPPLNWMMGVVALGDRDASYTYRLPAGNYSLLEVYHLTERGNTDFDYIPEGRYYYRPLGVVPLVGGQTVNYTSPALDPGPAGDWGQSLTAAGFFEDPTNPCNPESSPTPTPTPDTHIITPSIPTNTPTNTPPGTLEPTHTPTPTPTPDTYITPSMPTNTPTNMPTGTLEPTYTPTPTPNPTAVAYVGGFTGTWDTNWGEMTCNANGASVHCEYTWDQGRIDATLSADGRTMDGQWTESPSYSPPDDGGRVTFTLSEDGNAIDGYWWYGQNTDGGTWTGTRR